MGRVLIVGSTNTDLVCHAPRLPRTGETLRGTGFATYPGGKGANQAVAAARAGATVRFVGAVGSDPYGEDRIGELAAEGIDIGSVRVVAGVVSGIALIVVDETGDNSIIIVAGANATVSADDARAAIAERRHDLLSLTLEIPFNTVASAVAANLGRTPTVLNAAPFDSRVAELLPSIDVLVVNEGEAGAISGGSVTPQNAGVVASELVRSGPRAVVITLGADGAVVATESDVRSVAAPRVAVLDTTGAGDAFCGALCARLSEGAALIDAVRFGVAAGSLAVGVVGAQPAQPRADQILALLRQMPTQ